MRRFFLVIFASIAVALAAYTGYWFRMSDRLRVGVTRWADARRAEGRSLGWDEMAVDGYPLAFRVRLRNAVLDGMQPLPYEVLAPTLIGEARPWDLQRWRLTAPAGIRVAAPSETETISADGLDGNLTLGSSDGTVVDLVARHAIASGVVSGLGADRVAVRLALPDHALADHRDTAFAATIQLDQATLPTALPPFGSTIELLNVEGTLKGAPPSGPLRPALDAWRAAGGTIELQQGTLRWGSLAMTATGTLALDEALQPMGAFTATIENQNAIVDAAVAGGALRAGNANAVKLVLGLLAKPGPDGKQQLTVPISLQNGDSISARRKSRYCPRSFGSSVRRPLLRRLRPVGHAVLAQHRGDAEAVIREDLAAAAGLRAPVPLLLTPALDRRLVAPERYRHDLAGIGQARKTLDRDEAVDLLEVALQRRGHVEIILRPSRLGFDLEDDNKHRPVSSACAPDCHGRARRARTVSGIHMRRPGG